MLCLIHFASPVITFYTAGESRQTIAFAMHIWGTFIRCLIYIVTLCFNRVSLCMNNNIHLSYWEMMLFDIRMNQMGKNAFKARDFYCEIRACGRFHRVIKAKYIPKVLYDDILSSRCTISWEQNRTTPHKTYLIPKWKGVRLWNCYFQDFEIYMAQTFNRLYVPYNFSYLPFLH